MITEGGITVKQGEIRRDQPFRIGLMDIDEHENEFWTTHPEEGVVIFELIIKRIQRSAKR